MAAKKKKVGRPSKYNPKMGVLAIELGRDGASKAEICAALGIHPDTFYEYKKKYPEFTDAIKESHMLAKAWWEKKGREATFNASGFSATSYIFQMKNRFPEDWRDKKDIEVSDADQPSDVKQNYARILELLERIGGGRIVSASGATETSTSKIELPGLHQVH